MGSLSCGWSGWPARILLFLLLASVATGTRNAAAGEEGMSGAVGYLCSDVLAGTAPDAARLAPVLEFVRAHADSAVALPEYQGAPGAYQGFPIRLPLRRLLRYLYNPAIPQEVLKPFSIRSSVWTDPDADSAQKRLWADPWPPAAAVSVLGLQRDRTTPDPSTGGCYGMVLRRTIVLLPEERAALSVSVQDGPSEVGTKGYFLGDESGGRYVYSGEKGLTKTGLGWVSSRIQSNVSIAVYLETDGGEVVSGVFQWMRAGWSGLSVIRESHIAASLARYRALFTARLGVLPGPERLEELFVAVAGRSDEDLRAQARGVFGRWLDAFGGLAAPEAVKLLGNGYAERLDRGELVALGVRENLAPSAQTPGASGVQTSWLAPTLSFQPLSTSR